MTFTQSKIGTKFSVIWAKWSITFPKEKWKIFCYSLKNNKKGARSSAKANYVANVTTGTWTISKSVSGKIN